MKKIKIIAVGKVNKDYLLTGIKEYQKWISRYAQLEIFDIEEVALKKEENQLLINKTLEEEQAKIEKLLQNQDFVIALCSEGESLTSVDLARKMQEQFDQGRRIAFIIGSSYGLKEDLKKRADVRLSFSTATFPHQMVKLMLLEQIYRSCKINANETYHK